MVGGNPFSSQEPPGGPETPFYSDMRSCLIVVHILLSDASHKTWQEYVLLAPSQVIEKFCHGSEPQDVPWAQWSRNVRLVEKHKSDGIFQDCHIFQTRYVRLQLPDSETSTHGVNSTRLAIYDFSPALALRRDAQHQTYQNCEYIFEPSIVSKGGLWRTTVVTGVDCPFRIIYAKPPNRKSQILADAAMFLMEDCVVVGDIAR